MSWQPGNLEFQYRAMQRHRRENGEWSAWVSIYTARGGGRAYQTIGAARGVLTREKNDNQRHDRWDRSPNPVVEREYKIQRRPLGEWEDVNG